MSFPLTLNKSIVGLDQFLLVLLSIGVLPQDQRSVRKQNEALGVGL